MDGLIVRPAVSLKTRDGLGGWADGLADKVLIPLPITT